MDEKELNKDNLKGLQLAYNAIKHLPRYDIEWEWISEQKKGNYLDREQVLNILLKALKERKMR